MARPRSSLLVLLSISLMFGTGWSQSLDVSAPSYVDPATAAVVPVGYTFVGRNVTIKWSAFPATAVDVAAAQAPDWYYDYPDPAVPFQPSATYTLGSVADSVTSFTWRVNASVPVGTYKVSVASTTVPGQSDALKVVVGLFPEVRFKSPGQPSYSTGTLPRPQANTLFTVPGTDITLSWEYAKTAAAKFANATLVISVAGESAFTDPARLYQFLATGNLSLAAPSAVSQTVKLPPGTTKPSLTWTVPADFTSQLYYVAIALAGDSAHFGYTMFGIEDRAGAPTSVGVTDASVIGAVSYVVGTSATVTWAPPANAYMTGAVSYNLRLSYGDIREATTAELSYTFDNLEYNSLYTLRITAINLVGIGASADISFSNVANPLPTAPTGLYASEIGMTSFLLTFNAPANYDAVLQPVTYRVYADDAQVTQVPQPAVMLSGLAAGKTYKIQADALDGSAHASLPSDPIYVTTIAAAAVPVNVTYRVLGSTAARVSWAAPVNSEAHVGLNTTGGVNGTAVGNEMASNTTFEPVTGSGIYRVFIYKWDLESLWKVLSGIEATTVVLDNLEPSTMYYVQVAELTHTLEEGPRTAPVSFTTRAAGTTTDPTTRTNSAHGVRPFSTIGLAVVFGLAALASSYLSMSAGATRLSS